MEHFKQKEANGGVTENVSVPIMSLRVACPIYFISSTSILNILAGKRVMLSVMMMIDPLFMPIN